MKKNRTVPLVLLALVLASMGLGVWFSTREDEAREAALAPLATSADERAPETSERAVTDAPPPREVAIVADDVEAITAKNLPTPPPPTRTWTVHGRVLDVLGRGVAGIDVHEATHADTVRARTQSDGSFAFEFDGDHFQAEASGPTWISILTGSIEERDRDLGVLIVVAPATNLAGRVVDESGLGVDGARVRFELGDEVLAGFPERLDRTGVPYPSVHVTRDGGAFAFTRFPALPRTKIAVTADGFSPGAVTVDPSLGTVVPDVLVTLSRLEKKERVLRGTVVHADGSPAPDANVHLGEARAAVDASGTFVVEVPRWLHDEQPLVAAERGLQSAIHAGFGRVAREGPFPLAPVRLVLGGPALTIVGRIVDAEDRPLSGWSVSIRAGSDVSHGRVPAVTAEDLAADGSSSDQSDTAGRFELKGLFDREYDLFAYDPRTLVRLELAAVRAGTQDVVLRSTSGALVPRVTGHVVALDGSPVAGAEVRVGLVVASSGDAKSWINGATTRTGADGSFELADVPARHVHLDVGGDPVIPRSHPLAEGDASRPVRIEVERRCHFRIEGLPALPTVQWLAAHDADGQELDVWEFQSSGWSSTNRVQFTVETTRVYAVSERAVELVLYHPYDTVSARRPLRLVPGDVTLVRW